MNSPHDESETRKPLWIGFQDSESELAEMIAEFVRSVGIAVRLRRYKRLPRADALAGQFSWIRDTEIVWLLREDAPNRKWVERESVVQSFMRKTPVFVFRVESDETIVGPDEQLITSKYREDMVISIAHAVYPGVDFSRRRILVVQDAFQISERGVALTPKVAPCHLIKGWKGARAVEIRRPDGERMICDAIITSIFQTPPPEDSSRLSIFIPDASKNDFPAGSEVWLFAKTKDS